MSHQGLKSLFTQDLKHQLSDEEQNSILKRQIGNEIQIIQKSMNFLPTLKEAEALPDLIFVLDLTKTLKEEKNYFDSNFENDKASRNFIIDQLFTYVSYSVIKTKIYNEKKIIRTADLIFENLVEWATKNIEEENIFLVKMLNVIINSHAEYYKTNGRDQVQTKPFGEEFSFQEHQLEWIKELKVGDLIDYSRKTPDGRIIWIPAEVVEIFSNSGRIEIKYLKDNQVYFVFNLIGVRKYGEKNDSYNWRRNIKEKDRVMFFFEDKWAEFEVVTMDGEGMIEISEVVNQKIEDQVIETDIYSELLARKGEIHEVKSQEDWEDELYLETSDKKKYAILRQIHSASSSTFIVKYINIFGEHGGFDYILKIIRKQKLVEADILNEMLNLLRNSMNNLVKPFIRSHGKEILEFISDQVLNDSIDNLRSIDKQNLGNFLDIIQTLSQRIFSPEKARETYFSIELKLAMLCLKSNILEKQFFAIKIMSQMEKKCRSLELKNQKQYLGKVFKREEIFILIVKGHHSLIAKSQSVMRILFSEDLVSKEELNIFWEQIVKSDNETKNSLLSLLKEVIMDFSKNEVIFFLDKMEEKADSINNLELILLVFKIKKMGQNQFKDEQVVKRTHDVIWSVLQSSQDMKKEFLKEVIFYFIRCIDETNIEEYAELLIKNILEEKNTLRNLKILKKLLKQCSDAPLKVYELVKSTKLVNSFIKDIEELIKKKMRQNHERGGQEENNLSEKENNIVKKKLNFLKQLQNQIENQNIITFENFQKIWNSVLRTNFQSVILNEWLRNYISKQKVTDIEKLRSFFNENVDEFKKIQNSDLLIIIILVFFKINMEEQKIISREVKLESQGYYSYNTKTKQIKILQVPLEELEGYDKMWNLFLTNSDPDQQKQLCNFITKILEKPDIQDPSVDFQLYEQEKNTLFSKLREMTMSMDTEQARKGINAIQFLMLREEQFGFGQLYSFESLQSLPKQAILFEKVNTYMNTDKHTVLLKKNKTLAHLRLYISKEYSMSFQSINLTADGQQQCDYSHQNNSKTLESLKIKQFNHFNVNEYELLASEQPFVILNKEKTNFTPEVIKIFQEVFNNFSDEGKMSKEQMAKFTSKATDGIYCGPNDDRIQNVFREYANNEEYMNFDQFISFYRDCALTSDYKLETVQNNLISLGYDSSLALKNFQKSQHFYDLLKYSLRYILSKDKELHDQIMKQHINDQFDEQIYQAYKFFTPNFDLIIDFIGNPLKNLKSNELSLKQWNYNIIILETLFFKQSKIQKILNFIDYQINQEERTNFHKQVFNQVFFENILRKVDQMNISQINDFQVLYAPYHIINSILIILTDFFVKDYIHDTKNFLIYSMKLKKKKKEDQKHESAGTQIGPMPKEEQTSQDPAPLDEKKKQSSEEKCLLAIKSSLESFNFDFNQYKNSLPFKKLIEVCINNLSEVLLFKEDEKDNIKDFYTFNLITLLSCLNFQKDILKKYLSEKDSKFKEMIFKGLTHKKTIIRILFKNFYLFLTQIIKDDDIKREFLAVIINNIQTSIQNDDIHLLIELASNLLKEISELKQTSDCKNLHRQFDFKKIFGDFSQKLINYKTKEETFDSKEDNTLTAILTFLQKIIQVDNNILIDIDQKKKSEFVLFLFKNCLFDVSQKQINFQNVLCKSTGSRQSAMELLAIMVKDDPKSIILLYLKGFTPLSNHLPDSQTKQFMESTNKKSNHGFIGIRNPGCICYMNAMIQQFYFIPTFRYGILLAEDSQEENMEEIMPNYQIDDNTFHQFQKLFAYLDLSKRSDFNPRDFCASYKDMTGQRVNVMVQQDSFEFLNVIFDKLENSLKGSPFQGILDSVFRGKIRTVFECQNCKFSRFKQEVFYNVSLEVKNLENIDESFQKFISKETISDYTCDACKRKCDVTKQSFLQDLPNVLIVHLQKIIFDLELLTNIKISSKFSFPQVLNLKQYIHEDVIKEMEENASNLSDDDFQYKLVGVVIHRGNAHFGHYTSLINVNRKDPNRPDRNKDEWYEFDDSKIYPFNMKNFEEECFGTKMKQDYTANYYGVENNVSKSAYILVFDKVKKDQLRLKFNEQNMNEFQKVEKVLEKNSFIFKDNILETDFYSLQPYIPDQYKSTIQNDNIQMILENQLFSSNFTSFLNEILAKSTLPNLSIDVPPPYPDLDTYQLSLCDIILQILPSYFYKIYCSTFYNLSIKKIVGYMETALIYRPEKILQFFETNVYNQFYEIKSILENNSDYSVHMSLSRFISFTLTLLIREYNIHEYNQNQEGKSVQQQQIEYKLFNFLDGLKSLSPLEQQEIKINKKMLSYFQILQNVCSLNPVVAYYYLNKNYLTKLYDLFMSTDMMTSKNNDKVINSIVSFIEILLQQVKRKMSEEVDSDNYHVVQQYFQKFGNLKLIKKVMDEDFKFNRYQSLKNIIWLICQDDFSMQKELIRYALKSIKSSSESQSFGYFECLNALLQMDDEHRGEKIQMIFGVPKLMELKVEKNKQMIYLYGLSKESSLNRHMFKYPSTLNMEKSLTDMLMTFKEQNELQVMFIIYYLILFSSQYKEVLRYLLEFPPHNYLCSNLLDWVICYVNYQLKIIPNSYNPPRQDIYYSYIKPLENMVKDLKNFIDQTLLEDHKFSPEQIQSFNYFQQPEEHKEEIQSLNKNYIVGKTIETKLVFKQSLLKEENSQLLLTCHISRVALMEYTSDGYSNFRIPKEALSFNMYLNKKELSPQLDNFLNTSYNNIIYEDEEDYVQMLKPIGDSDDEQPEKPTKQEQLEDEEEYIHKVSKQKVLELEETFEANYVFRIALKNKGDDHYLVELKIEGSEENHFLGTYNIFVKNSKKDFIVCNLHSRNLQTQFDGLTIKARVHKFPSVLDKYFHAFEDQDFEVIYKYKPE